MIDIRWKNLPSIIYNYLLPSSFGTAFLKDNSSVSFSYQVVVNFLHILWLSSSFTGGPNGLY